jgi:hypothetical protein
MPLPIVILTVLMLATAPPTPPGPSTSPAVDPAALGPAVGQAIPMFEASDQQGHPRDFLSLEGPNGLVLVFFRSADW